MVETLGGDDPAPAWIGRATGMVMEQHGLDERAALALLMEAAEGARLGPAELAREMVESWP
jgi:AmiR/NasT family two-component response regulator